MIGRRGTCGAVLTTVAVKHIYIPPSLSTIAITHIVAYSSSHSYLLLTIWPDEYLLDVENGTRERAAACNYISNTFGQATDISLPKILLNVPKNIDYYMFLLIYTLQSST